MAHIGQGFAGVLYRGHADGIGLVAHGTQGRTVVFHGGHADFLVLIEDILKGQAVVFHGLHLYLPRGRFNVAQGQAVLTHGAKLHGFGRGGDEAYGFAVIHDRGKAYGFGFVTNMAQGFAAVVYGRKTEGFRLFADIAERAGIGAHGGFADGRSLFVHESERSSVPGHGGEAEGFGLMPHEAEHVRILPYGGEVHGLGPVLFGDRQQAVAVRHDGPHALFFRRSLQRPERIAAGAGKGEKEIGFFGRHFKRAVVAVVAGKKARFRGEGMAAGGGFSRQALGQTDQFGSFQRCGDVLQGIAVAHDRSPADFGRLVFHELQSLAVFVHCGKAEGIGLVCDVFQGAGVAGNHEKEILLSEIGKVGQEAGIFAENADQCGFVHENAPFCVVCHGRPL